MEIMGPAGDLVARGFTRVRARCCGGDGAGAALESPTAVRNLAKGADMAATGMYRDTKGYKVIDTTLAEAAAKAIGFQPKSVAEVQEANSFMQRSKSFYTQTSSTSRRSGQTRCSARMRPLCSGCASAWPTGTATTPSSPSW
jgi:hypothetical protein